MKNVKSEEIKKADDKPMKTVDWKKQLQEFMIPDDKKYILFGELVERSDLKEAEVLEVLFSKVFDSIKEKMLLSDNIYNKQDLRDVNFFLHYIKWHICGLECKSVEVIDVSNGLGLSYATR